MVHNLVAFHYGKNCARDVQKMQLVFDVGVHRIIGSAAGGRFSRSGLGEMDMVDFRFLLYPYRSRTKE
jgi:hypothetical protein